MMLVPVYAAIIGLLFIAISLRTIMLRRSKQIAIGTADDPEMARGMRAHANFAEYVPLALLLLFFAEQSGSGAVTIHILCCALILGRVLHFLAVSKENEDLRLRVTGMILTLGTIISACVRILSAYLF